MTGWQKHSVRKFALHIPIPAPSPKKKPNTGTPQSQRSEIPGAAVREGASPRCDEDNKGKKAGGDLGKRGSARAGNGTTVGVGRGGHREQKPWRRRSFQRGAGVGGGSLQGRPKAAATRHCPPALPGPWARGTGPSQRRRVPAGIGEGERGSGRSGWCYLPASGGAAAPAGGGRGAALGP